VPVEFLTDAEAASYGRYNGPPPRAELERAFFLDDADKALIARRRGDLRGATAEEMRRHWLPAELDEVRDRVLFTGWLTPAETAAWYARADVLVIPSWYEPFGMVVLEGMLEGMAIAASNVGGPGEILDHDRTGLLFAPRDVEALARSVVRLAVDPGLRDRLGTAASDEVRRNWLWPSAIRQDAELYAQAVNVGFRTRGGSMTTWTTILYGAGLTALVSAAVLGIVGRERRPQVLSLAVAVAALRQPPAP